MAQHHDPSIFDQFVADMLAKEASKTLDKLIFSSIYPVENPAHWIVDLLELVEKECREHNIREPNV